MTPPEIEAELMEFPFNLSPEKLATFADAVSELYLRGGKVLKTQTGTRYAPFQKACARRIKTGRPDDFRIAIKWALQDTRCPPEQLLAIKTLIFG